MTRAPRGSLAALGALLAGLAAAASYGQPVEPAPGASPRRPATTDARRYLLYRVNPAEGFNLRRDAFLRAALLVRRLGLEWTLVLPPFERLPHWRSPDLNQDQVGWATFFDLAALRAAVPVIEHAEFRALHEGALDRALSLRQPQPAPAGAPFSSEPESCPAAGAFPYRVANEHTETLLHGEWVEVGARECRLAFLPFSELSPLLRASGATSLLVDNLEVLFWDGSYGGPEWWEVRSKLRFAAAVRERAEDFRRARFGEQPYLAVHLRRGDFLAAGRPVPSLSDAAAQIRREAAERGLERLLLATDARDDEVETLARELRFERFRPPAGTALLDGVVAMIDQWLCVRATAFVGSATSTFTRVIQEERQLLGRPDAATFRVLCPARQDATGRRLFDCEQPRPFPIPAGLLAR